MADPPLEPLELNTPFWERVFHAAPLVLVGSREESGAFDLAPKHLVAPMWGPWFAFVCAERHATYRNAVREGAFTVSWPRPSQVVLTSLTASPRCEGGEKEIVKAVETFPARVVEGVFVRDAYFFLECHLDRTVDGFDDNSLVIGRVAAAYASPEYLRASDRDDAELIRDHPLLAYLDPSRFAVIRESRAFPFPKGFRR